jgi:TPR repeat protein
MARLEIASDEMASLASAQMDGRAFYELGVMYAAGRAVELDRVTAHKWLNIAALRGCREAVSLRTELACEMSPTEIADAQRAARLWLSLH